MVSIKRTRDGAVEIQIVLPSPTIYLDYGVIGKLAGTDQGARLRERISDNGTLYFSWAHLIELFSLGNGPTFDRIVKYLASFGANFILIDADSEAVMKREREWVIGRQNPAVDETFLGVLAANWHGGSTELSIGNLLEFMAQNDELFTSIKAMHGSFKQKVKAIVDTQRLRYKTDKLVRKQLDGATYLYEPPIVTPKVSLELGRECVRTNEIFSASDALDFLHAIVSISYCDYVVLDKKWARRGRALNLPRGTAAIFDGTEIDKLLGSLGSSSCPPI